MIIKRRSKTTQTHKNIEPLLVKWWLKTVHQAGLLICKTSQFFKKALLRYFFTVTFRSLTLGYSSGLQDDFIQVDQKVTRKVQREKGWQSRIFFCASQTYQICENVDLGRKNKSKQRAMTNEQSPVPVESNGCTMVTDTLLGTDSIKCKSEIWCPSNIWCSSLDF